MARSTTPHSPPSAPPLTVTLGDRTTVTVTVTVRFRLMPDQLRLIHERFGPQGIFNVVRDETSRAVQRGLGAPDIGVKDLLGASREVTESMLAQAVTDALQRDGIELTVPSPSGASTWAAPARWSRRSPAASYELEREEVEALTRLARARNDAELQQLLQPGARWPGDTGTRTCGATWRRARSTSAWPYPPNRPETEGRVAPGHPSTPPTALTDVTSDPDPSASEQ